MRGQADDYWQSSSPRARSTWPKDQVPGKQSQPLLGSIDLLGPGELSYRQSEPSLTAPKAVSSSVAPKYYPVRSVDIGLKTPSPSPTSQTPAKDYLHQESPPIVPDLHPSIEQEGRFSNPTAPYIAMDQQHQQYLSSQQSHLSEGQPYASHASTSSNMSQYPQFHQNPPVLQPAPNTYTQSPSSYTQHYSFPSNGMTSPHGSSHSVSSSINPHMGSGLPPLPSKYCPSCGSQRAV